LSLRAATRPPCVREGYGARVTADSLPELDPGSATLAQLGDARERSWAARSDRGFEVLRYAEGMALLRDRRFRKGGTFLYRLDAFGITEGPVREAWNRMLVTNDGEARTHLRLPVSRLLGHRQMAKLQDTVRAIVGRVLDDAPAGEDVDLMQHVAWRIPPLVYCELFSAPPEEAARAARLSDSTLGPILTMDAARRQESIDAFVESEDFIRTYVDRRRGDPGDDFTSALIREQEAGNLTESELVETGIGLLQASIDNTVHQIGLTLGTLLEDPARWERVVADPELIGPAIEEVIRLRPRFGTIFRIAAADLELNGLEVREGGAVFVSVRAGQRDPRRFEDPDAFVLDREPVPPLMFGNGPYSCLGQHLARMEVRALLEAMTERFPGARLSAPMIQEDFDAVTEVAHLRGTLA
jgi:cytochrome P450 family 103